MVVVIIVRNIARTGGGVYSRLIEYSRCPLPLLHQSSVQKRGRIFGWYTHHYGTSLQYAVLSPCRLNLPGCLPDVYVPMKDPQPCGGKSFIGALFGGGPSEMNREEIRKSILLNKLSLSDRHQ